MNIRTAVLLALLAFQFPRFLPAQTPAVDFAWSTFVTDPVQPNAGSLMDMTVDAQGNVYTTGQYGSQAVVYKLDASGTFLHWTFVFGGSRGDFGKALDLGPDGSIYVIGRTNSEDFPVSPNAFQPLHGDGSLNNTDVFVARIAPSGDSLLYASYFGGLGDDYPGDVKVNAAGDCFVGGFTNGGFIPTTSGAFDETFNGAPGFSDAFVFRTPPTMDQLTYSTYLGGTQSESINEIALNEDDEVVMTGEMNSPDFPTTPGAIQPNKLGGGAMGFMSRISADGSQLLASTYFGSSAGDYAEGMDLTPEGDVIIVGRTNSLNLPTTPNAVQANWTGTMDAFVARISKDATVFQYGSFIGGERGDVATDVEINGRGEVFITGNSISLEFPLTECALDSVPQGGGAFWGGDVWLVKLDSSMGQLRYSSFIGGAGEEIIPRVIVGEDACDQEVWLAMTTESTDYPTTPGVLLENKPGGRSFAVTKWEENTAIQAVAPDPPCPVPGEPYPLAVEYDGCGHWSDLSGWVWDLGDGRILTDSAIAPAFLPGQARWVTVARPGCPPEDSVWVDPFNVELGPDLSLCPRERRLLQPVVGPGTQLLWPDGQTGTTYAVDRSGWLAVQATNDAGCVARDSIFVNLLESDSIQTPNVFSPNGDQINDRFFVTGLEGLAFSLEVFDRWGRQVYQADAYQNDWEGGDLSEGVYYYVLRHPGGCGVRHGAVNLIR